MWKEFKTFIFRGNVMDLAVGVIIATSFAAIVNSLVKDIIMPCVGMLTSGVDFAALKVVLKPAVLDAAGAVAKPEVAIGYGIFINTIITFLIVALVIFLVVKMINKNRAAMDAKLKKTKAEEPAPEIPADVALLTEIRDLLKIQNK
ncbi:MAG: large-conductance mechanosensitive channel protein MscL [Eubacteriales bacterium]